MSLSRKVRENITAGTAAVTLYGFESGDLFEGCVSVAGQKRGEPQDWERDATSPQARGGGNRRGDAKSRGRNRRFRYSNLDPETQAGNGSGGSGRLEKYPVEGRCVVVDPP